VSESLRDSYLAIGYFNSSRNSMSGTLSIIFPQMHGTGLFSSAMAEEDIACKGLVSSHSQRSDSGQVYQVMERCADLSHNDQSRTP
jgi:hypothetical protein